jgi:hypothetical protein
MNITPSGNVGIGIGENVDAGARLEVNGDAALVGTHHKYTYATNTGILVKGNEAGIDLIGSDAGNHASSILLRNATKGFGFVNDPGNEALILKSFTTTANGFNIHDGTGTSGLVDIITFAKDGKVILKPEQDSGNILQINGADTSSELLEVGITSGHVQFTATHASGGSNGCGYIFRTRHTSGGTTEKLRIQTSGQILHSSSSGDNQFTSRRTNVAGSSGDYFFHLNAQNRTPQTVGGLGFHQDGAEDSSRFVVLTRKTGGSNVARLNVMSGGDVRINVDGAGSASSERGVLRFYRTGYSDSMLDSRIVFDSSIGTNATNDGTYAASIAGRRSGDNNGSSELSFYTCNNSNSFAEQERLRIDSDGKIGVGGAPSANWHSAATSNVIQVGSSVLFDYSSAQFDVGHNYYYDGSDYKFISTGYAERITFSKSDGSIRFWSLGTGSADANATVTERLSIANDGVITINTVPATNNNVPQSVLFQTAAGEIHGGSGLTYNPGADVLSVNGNIIGPNVFYGAGAGPLTFAVANYSSTQYIKVSNKIEIKGNVGINVANPTGNFEVSGNDGINISNATRTGTNGAQWRLIPHSGGANAGAATNLRLYEGVGATEVLNITKTGFVGIGTNAPAQMLDVNGSVALYKRSGTDPTRLIMENSTSNLASSARIEFWEGSHVGAAANNANACIEYDASANHGGDGAILIKGYTSAANQVIAGFSRDGSTFLTGTAKFKRTATYTSTTSISITHNGAPDYGSLYFDSSLSTGGFVFRPGGSERLRVNSSGINVNGAVRPTGGINFIDAADVATGETVSSSVLDDYEEGTFTPSLKFGGGNTGMSVGSNTGGSYTKVGRLVFVHIRVEIATRGSSTGAATISSLPFVVGNIQTGGSSIEQSCAIGGYHQNCFITTSPTGASPACRMLVSTNTALLSWTNVLTGDHVDMSHSAFDGNASFAFDVVYQV